MMRKLVSLLLTAAMLCSLGSAAFAAEETLANAMKTVTEKVKNQIDISDDFTEFNGRKEDNGYHEYWDLTWSKQDGATLSVDVSTAGKIMSYSFSPNNDSYPYDSQLAPSFPKMSRETAKEIATSFMKKIVASPEGFEFQKDDSAYQPNNIENYNFSGAITLNGIPSPNDFSIQVNIQSKSVRYFSRDDFNTKYIGTVPSPKPGVSKDAAEKLLNGTVKLKLEYTTTANPAQKNEKDSVQKAVLRYIPEYQSDYLVDAQNGTLVDLSKLYQELETNPPRNELSGAGATPESKLTDVEKVGIDKISGVLSKEKLDSAVRSIPELGLNGFTLNHTYYYLNSENEYFCNLDYSKIESKDHATYKYVTINAKTAILISMYTNYTFDHDKQNHENKNLTTAQTQKKAEDFLSKYFHAQFSKTKLYQTNGNQIGRSADFADEFDYAQQANGYFFPENAYDIAVNKDLGTIDRFGSHFTEVVFDAPDGIISMDQALSAYHTAFTTQLSYVNFPKKLDLTVPEYEPFLKRGYHYLYELKLAYTREAENPPSGVDAKTGKLIQSEGVRKGVLTYSDIKSDKEILTLASYGIGFPGEQFEKTKELTQLDMLTLLVSAKGSLYNADQTDELYQQAYNLRILKKGDRNETKKITRAELVKTMISMSGYGNAAELKGIYVCSFKDKTEIPAACYGYVAIAQGLGMIKSGADITFHPNAVASREQAAIMLYNLMSR